MKIIYTARKVTLKDNFKERVEKKLGKFDRIFGEGATANVTVTLHKNRQTVEVTIRDNGMVYRAESSCDEMNDALDRVVDILGGLIRKNKARLSKRIKSGASAIESFIADYPTADTVDEDEEFNVARTKSIPVKPLSVEEAILQMNMVDHQFFMFRNADTNEINLVYKRNDGKYGLLIPEY